MKTITAEQLRAGRALVGISAEALAQDAGVGVATIRRAELCERETRMSESNVAAVRAALEARGVKFIEESKSGGPGVRLRS